jgi:thiol reductant ABC exporter CydC subunit
VPAASGLVGRAAGSGRAEAQGLLSAELVELLRGAPELVVYGREEDALERFRAADAELARLARRDALAAGVADGLAVAIAGVTTVAVLAAAVSAHAAGDLDRALVAAVTLLALASFEAVSPLPLAARELASTLAAGRRVLELIEDEPSVEDPPVPSSKPPRSAPIVLEGVTARYSADAAPALEDFSLRLEPGKRVALVGPSGVGKTTVVNLLLRFLDPSAGRITLGGQDLRGYLQEDVRRTVAVAGQGSYLFSTSILENVRLARPDATEAEIDDALRRAKIGDWVESLPDGARTLVGEEGAQLSGGQRQRVALARALLSEAPVLVLDEPTAHLDPETAEDLVRDILTAADGRGVLRITHRPEGLDLVDEVVTLG